MAEYYAVIDRDEDGQFFASVPELPGCHSCGETMEELLSNLEEAIELYLEAVGRPHEFPSVRKNVSAHLSVYDVLTLKNYPL